MKFKNYQYTPKKRRGLSSIVGALLFVVLMVATFSVMGVSLNSQTEIVSTSRAVANMDWEKSQEDFTMASATNPAIELAVNVKNNGEFPLEIFSLVVTDSQDEFGVFATTVYDIPSDASYIMPDKTENILATTVPPITLILPLPGNNDKVYTFKTISSRGNIAMDSIVCTDLGCSDPVTLPGAGALRHSLFMDGPTAINTKTSTLVMFVTNTSDETVTDVQPFFGFDDPGPINCGDGLWSILTAALPPDDFAETITNCTITPTTAQTLGPHETMLFKWDFTVGGDIGTVYQFCNYVTGDDGVTPTIDSQPQTCDEIEVIDPNDCDGCGPGGTTIILLDDLLNRPSIFLTIPSPFGDAEEKGLWGINVANPTQSTIEVPRIVITAFTPGSQDQDLLWDDGGQNYCDPVSVGSPNFAPVAQNWSCNQENVLIWQDYVNPIVLGPYSAQSFLAKALPGASGASNDEPNTLVISANVFSSFGSFGKGNYQTIMLGGGTQNPGIIVNVYMSNVLNGSADNEIETIRMNIDADTVQNFNMVLTDFDEDTEHAIGIGTKFIINVPREWHTVGIDSCVGFDLGGPCDEVTVTLHDDGSFQIVATTTELIGDITGGPDSRTIQFHVTAPDVSQNRMYLMYVLANGLTEPADSPIGPLSEIVLHVVP